MKPPRILPTLVLALMAAAQGSARAEGPSTDEYVAFQDFTIRHCAQHDPERSKEYEKLRNPPYACAPEDRAIAEKARQSTDYASMTQKLTERFSTLSASQRIEVCRSTLAAKCGG
ncbi:hypothetical protein AACH06_02455 [Ideonella sp. DXS29W]|uniref:Secreted protein n=1 Tax=Ideonella lacteola TaxID=2984193 RepID=A0ABU9BKS0_9BURK